MDDLAVYLGFKKLIAFTISLIILSLMSFSLTINQTWEIILMSNDF